MNIQGFRVVLTLGLLACAVWFAAPPSEGGGGDKSLSLAGVDTSMIALSDDASPPRQQPEYVPRELIVRFNHDASKAQRAEARKSIGAERKSRLPIDDAELLSIPAESSVLSAATKLAKHRSVKYAEQNGYVSAAQVPSDPQFESLWGLNNTGQTSAGAQALPDADIDAPEAWETFIGSADVRVAVVDTGIDYQHPDLEANIWSNPGESGNGRETNDLDDDGNGVVDDFRGADFVTSTEPGNDPMDVNGHGTHVAGTIGAVGDNDLGVVGVNWQTTLVPVKALNDVGVATWAQVASGLDYAGAIADVVNASLGGTDGGELMADAVASNPEALYVFAAGNDTSDVDAMPFFPCAIPESNVICVAATDSADQLAEFSNFGETSVHLAAPGVDVNSTVPGDSYDVYSGTSMASPHVAGAAALFAGFTGDPDPETVKGAILDSTDPLEHLEGIVSSAGRLNLAALLGADEIENDNSFVYIQGGVLRFLAKSGVMNDVVVSQDAGQLSVVDVGSDIEAGSGCQAISSEEVHCPVSSVEAIRINSLDLDDSIDVEVDLDTTVLAGSGDDQISTAGGDDALDGEAGADVISGGGGIDTSTYKRRSASVSVSLDGIANDGEVGEGDTIVGDIETIEGGHGGDIIVGSTSPDRLIGNEGNDDLSGGGGDDVIMPGPGTDALDGGDGSDTVDYSDRSTGVDVSLDGQANDGSGGENDDLGLEIENIRGSRGHDTLLGNDNDNVIDGDAGDDNLTPALGEDQVLGGTGNDTVDYSGRTASLSVTIDDVANDGQVAEEDNVRTDVENITGGSGDDSLVGNAGSNVIDGGLGADSIAGGDGVDAVSYATRTNSVDVTIGTGADDGEPGEEDDVPADVENLIGGSGNDSIEGSASNNRLDGGDGDDELIGGDGNDVLSGGIGADNMVGGSGTDTADYSERNDVDALLSGAPIAVNVTINGVANDGKSGELDNVNLDVENVAGTIANDVLTGSAGDNRLDGGHGRDILTGGDGNDTLVGGPSNEVFYQSVPGMTNRVVGGNGDDVFEIGPMGAQTSTTNGKLLAEVGADTYVSNIAVVPTLSYEQRSTSVTVSTDGIANDGASDEGDNVIGYWNSVIGGSGNDEVHAHPNGLIFSVTGGAGDDVITGGAGLTNLNGNAGNDLINVSSESNNDGYGHTSTFYGGSGIDTIDYSARTQAVNVSLDNEDQDGYPDERHFASPDIENLVGTDHDDVLAGNSAANEIDGGAGCDALTGFSGNDTLSGGPSGGVSGDPCANTYDGGEGDDKFYASQGSGGVVETLVAESGADTYHGEAGPNLLMDYSTSTASVSVSLDGIADDGTAGEGDNVHPTIGQIRGSDYADVLIGDAGVNAIWGGDGDDSIDGVSSGDELHGESGDDMLIEGANTGTGHDAFHGGDGNDTLSYDGRTAMLTINLAAGSGNGASAENDYIAGDIENANGGRGKDTITGTASANVLNGGANCDELNGLEGNDTLHGGTHSTPKFGNCRHTYNGGEGDDTIHATGGIGSLADLLLPEPGDDTYYGSGSTDVVMDYSTSAGSVSVSLDGVANDGRSGENDNVSSGIMSIVGSSHDDMIIGDDEVNYLSGGEGNDVIDGKQGGDSIHGQADDDTLSSGEPGGPWTDALYGGSGNDTITYADRTNPVFVSLVSGASNGEYGEEDYIAGDIENAIGGEGADELSGNSAANVLTGGPGEDVLDGLGGDDTLSVRDGEDDPTLTCGDGSDSVLADLMPFDVTAGDCETVSRL